MKCPCHHCTDRHDLCWATCERYRAMTAENDARKAAQRKDAEATSFAIDGIRKARSYAHRRRRK